MEQDERLALLEDIATEAADGAAYDGVLITSDIAYSGQHAEYNRAKEFLEELFSRVATWPQTLAWFQGTTMLIVPSSRLIFHFGRPTQNYERQTTRQFRATISTSN